MTPPLLAIEDLRVTFRRNRIAALRRFSLEIGPGEVVALVGESGSGKTTAGLAVMGLIEPGAARLEGAIRLTAKTGETRDLRLLPERRLQGIRGNDVAMIFQEPMSSLDPIQRIGRQITEAIAVHRPMPAGAMVEEARRLLQSLAIPDPEKCLASYPHQLSGGMRQRVMIAIALSCRPRLLIADEPTTALDVTIQAQIIELLKRLQAETGMAILFITHDLGLVAEIAHRVIVMYAGEVVEAGPVGEVFAAPRMPYTRGLMGLRPRIGGGRDASRRILPLPGAVPDLAALPPGCAFHPRCPQAAPGRCDAAAPALEEIGPGRAVRCLRWAELGP